MSASAATFLAKRLLTLRAFAVALALLMGLAAAPAAVQAQVGFDRPGRDYYSFAVRSGDPAVCANRCDRDTRCRAWSFVYPSSASPRAMCWLKSTVPARVENNCCVSGVSGSGVVPPRGNNEFEIDRVGGDYRNFEVPAGATEAACAEACNKETRCRAWTYLRPGYGTASARCYLKSRITPPRKRPCCVSGVVR
jgi:hypothetical protein